MTSFPVGRGLAFGGRLLCFLICLFPFLPRVEGFSLPEGFIPYLDLSRDIGKTYCFTPGEIGIGEFWLIYEGIGISPGFRYVLPKLPFAFQIALLKGIPIEEGLISPELPTYGVGSFSIIPYKNLRYELEIVNSYLRNFGTYKHSAFGSHLNLVRKEELMNLGVFIGVYWERQRETFAHSIRECELFGGGEIILSKWFICPYFNFGLIRRLSKETTYVRGPEKISLSLSFGVKIQISGRYYIPDIMTKITAPKGWESFW